MRDMRKRMNHHRDHREHAADGGNQKQWKIWIPFPGASAPRSRRDRPSDGWDDRILGRGRIFFLFVRHRRPGWYYVVSTLDPPPGDWERGTRVVLDYARSSLDTAHLVS